MGLHVVGQHAGPILPVGSLHGLRGRHGRHGEVRLLHLVLEGRPWQGGLGGWLRGKVAAHSGRILWRTDRVRVGGAYIGTWLALLMPVLVAIAAVGLGVHSSGDKRMELAEGCGWHLCEQLKVLLLAGISHVATQVLEPAHSLEPKKVSCVAIGRLHGTAVVLLCRVLHVVG